MTSAIETGFKRKRSLIERMYSSILFGQRMAWLRFFEIWKSRMLRMAETMRVLNALPSARENKETWLSNHLVFWRASPIVSSDKLRFVCSDRNGQQNRAGINLPWLWEPEFYSARFWFIKVDVIHTRATELGRINSGPVIRPILIMDMNHAHKAHVYLKTSRGFLTGHIIFGHEIITAEMSLWYVSRE